MWTETIEEHREAVREATLDAAAALVAEHGLLSVTMSRVSEATGIGRATLYKYFPDVEAILLAWHERQVAAHLEQLVAIRDAAEDPARRLEHVLEAYALMIREQPSSDMAVLLHRRDHVDRAQQHLKALLGDLIEECARAGAVRGDLSPGELAAYCLHALGAATTAPSKAAVRRLVGLTIAGLEPRP